MATAWGLAAGVALVCGWLFSPPAAALAGEPLPTAQVADAAHLLPFDVAHRLTMRLHALYAASGDRLSLQVVTVDGARGRSPAEAVGDQVARWQNGPDSGDVDGMAVLFLFAAEGELRAYAGDSLPAEVHAAMVTVPPRHLAHPAADLEPAVERVIDLLAVRLHIDLPTLPAELPPIWGKPENDGAFDSSNVIEESATATIAAAIARAGRHGPPVILALNPHVGFDRPDQITPIVEQRWPAPTLLFVYQADRSVVLRPAPALAARFGAGDVTRIEEQIAAAMAAPRQGSGGNVERALVRSIDEIAAAAAGRSTTAWSPWRHPLQRLAGGPDADWHDGIVPAIFLTALLALLVFWGVLFVRDPKGTLLALAGFFTGQLLGGIFSGKGGGKGDGGGGGASGGGSFGGGGASGDW